MSENSGEGQFIINFTNYIDKAILCCISEDVDSLDGQVKTYLCMHSVVCED
jgi:hypothetical protein